MRTAAIAARARIAYEKFKAEHSEPVGTFTEFDGDDDGLAAVVRFTVGDPVKATLGFSVDAGGTMHWEVDYDQNVQRVTPAEFDTLDFEMRSACNEFIYLFDHAVAPLERRYSTSRTLEDELFGDD